MDMRMYVYIPKYIKNQTHGIAWSYVDGPGCQFYLLYFYFESKIGFGALRVHYLTFNLHQAVTKHIPYHSFCCF